MGFFSNLKKKKNDNKYLSKFTKTSESFTTKLKKISLFFKEVDAKFLEELLIVLLEADVGLSTSNKIIDKVKRTCDSRSVVDFDKVVEVLLEEMNNVYHQDIELCFKENAYGPNLILMVGVNGVGKTTSIAKLANYYKSQGKTVMLVAADTFRAGAIEQLKHWAKELDIPCISKDEGSDPASVIVDGIIAAKNLNIDYLLCDTAGRLQNKINLMNELAKIKRVAEKQLGGNYINSYLVIDSTTGQNGLNQAEVFLEATEVNGMILTKLDGTSKGGIVLAIKDKFNIPVKFIGVGEKIGDFKEFIIDDFLYELSGDIINE